ncbi:MAG: AtpZ/AtpI family protein [Dokdonia sp.]|jgi:hypothetical protein|nr:hypothetical protein [Cytophagaceae bacterium]
MAAKKENAPLKNWAIYSGIAIQMGVIIFLFVRGGKWLDQTYNAGGKLYTVIGTLAGVGLALFLVLQQTKRLNP